MYNILITTTYYTSAGVGVATSIASFHSKDEAEAAITVINNIRQPLIHYTQKAVGLY